MEGVMGENYQEKFQDYLERERHLGVIVLDRTKEFGSAVAMKHRPNEEWKEVTWDLFGEQIYATAGGLIKLGVGEEDMVGIFSENRAEWHVADVGSFAVRAIDVPIYPTNTAKEARYIINDAGIRVIFVGRQEQYDRVMEIFDDCKSLEYVIAFDKNVKVDTDRDEAMSFNDFLELGKGAGKREELEARLSKAHYDDIATIIYTSGTTGEPKGAVLTHKNLMHQHWVVGNYVLKNPGHGDIALSFLPLSHVFERSFCYGVFAYGAALAYCDDHTNILEYLADIRPTHMNSAPRLYEKVYSTIYGKLETAPVLKQKLFHWAVKTGKNYGSRKIADEAIPILVKIKYSIADRLIFSKIREAFGGRAFVFTSGGAAISAEILEFFYNAGMFILSGYGLTETAPVVACNRLDNFKFGTNGPVIPLVEGRVDSETGELQFRGPNVMKEYYNKPETTKAVFTEDGWFKTGDIGHFDGDGYLYITDRIKDLIITAGGKNIAPQMIETLMAEDYYIEYIAVVGEGRKYIAALIVPCFEVLEEYAASNNISFTSREDLVNKPEILKFYRGVIDERQKDLGRVEQIKKFTLLTNEFSQETGEITPTMKIKRRFVTEKYSEEIYRMYEE